MFLRGYKPDWLYEVLPYAYLVAGLITIFTLKNVMGAVSGLLLTSTGAAVWLMRRSYRSAMQDNLDQTSRGVDRGEQGTSLVKLIWRTSFEVGHEVIDRQHQGLVSLGNELINAVLTKRSKEFVHLLLHDLVDEVANHFQTEENIMAGYNNPLSEDHKEVHRSILARTKQLRDSFQESQLPVSDMVGFIVYDVVAEHIIKEELDFSRPLPDLHPSP